MEYGQTVYNNRIISCHIGEYSTYNKRNKELLSDKFAYEILEKADIDTFKITKDKVEYLKNNGKK